jgi:hypothetical protein
VVAFHLATEPPSERGPEGWAHAVADVPDIALTVCGLPVGALTDWPTVVFPDEASNIAYCPACLSFVERS